MAWEASTAAAAASASISGSLTASATASVSATSVIHEETRSSAAVAAVADTCTAAIAACAAAIAASTADCAPRMAASGSSSMSAWNVTGRAPVAPRVSTRFVVVAAAALPPPSMAWKFSICSMVMPAARAFATRSSTDAALEVLAISCTACTCAMVIPASSAASTRVALSVDASPRTTVDSTIAVASAST